MVKAEISIGRRPRKRGLCCGRRLLEHLKLFPGRRPWAFWKFEMGCDEPPDEDQPGILRRLGLLTKYESKSLVESHGRL